MIRVLLDHLLLADGLGPVIDRLADPQTGIVTLTITGDGYRTEPAAAPNPVFAALAAALDRRRAAGVPPFTVMSCDNLLDNGASTRTALLAAAEPRGGRLTDWIADCVHFPSSMVDRITPATTAVDRRTVKQELGLTDGWPVMTEPFTQWVIEDRFGAVRPPLDLVGVRFTDDVAPYKLVKSRMLNGAHCALGYLGSLAGHLRTDQALRDPVLVQYVEALLADEVGPLLPTDLPGMSGQRYRHTILERLRNAAIGDPLTRLCARGSTKMPAYLLPSLWAAQRAGHPRKLLLLAVAAWLRYLRGTTDDGRPINVEDARAVELGRLARASDPRVILQVTDIFGDLAEHQGDVDLMTSMLSQFEDRGVTATIRRFL